MLRWILFDTTLFNPGEDASEDRTDLGWILESLTQRNQNYLKQNPKTPRLYNSNVVYDQPAQSQGECPEVKILRDAAGKNASDLKVASTLSMVQAVLGGERFRDIGRIIENGKGDCFPLSQKIIVRSKSTGMYELLSIGDLRFLYVAYEALSYNFSTLKWEFKDIVGFVDKGVKEVSKARLSNGTDLVSTNEHSYWTIDGTGSNGRRLGTRTMGEYVEAMSMSSNRRTARSRILQASHIPILNKIQPSKAEAYLAGIYAAEGFGDMSHTNIAQHKSTVRAKIEMSLAEVGTSFSYRPGGMYNAKTAGSGASYRLRGGLADPVIAMMRGQGASSMDKHLPQEFLSGDEATIATLLEAHADGDAWRQKDLSGYKYPRPGLEAVYATSSDRLMEQLRLGMLQLGRASYAYQYQDHQGEGSSPIWRLHEYNEHAVKLQSREELLKDDLPGLRYGTVRNAVAFGKAHVGCIEVEGNHNFVLADGTLVSNCDNLACWRAAELRQGGVKAKPFLVWRDTSRGTNYHALVIHPDGPDPLHPYEGGSSEDPSLLLGMGGAARTADRQIEIAKNAERVQNRRDLLSRGGAPATAVDDLFDEVLGRGGHGGGHGGGRGRGGWGGDFDFDDLDLYGLNDDSYAQGYVAATKQLTSNRGVAE